MSNKSRRKRVRMGLVVVAACIVLAGLSFVLAGPETVSASGEPTTQDPPVIIEVLESGLEAFEQPQSTFAESQFELVLQTDGEGFEVDGDTVCVHVRIPGEGGFHLAFREGPLELNDPALPGAGLDLDATDGYGAIYIPGSYYDVWVQARGKPGGSMAWGQEWRLDPLWQVHTVTRTTGAPTWEGPWGTCFYPGFSSWTSPPFSNNALAWLTMRWFPL